MVNRVVLVTGGFDPLHQGHIDYINSARKLGDMLIVGVNSDAWLTRKKGRPFMPSGDRISILKNLKAVEHCFLFDDNDNSAIEAVNNAKMLYPNSLIIVANGGDRTWDNTLERKHFENDAGVEFVFGVGGTEKLNSSSWILEDWKHPKTERDWGYWRVLDDQQFTVKVKELTINPKCSLSMQRHLDRYEFWFIAEGRCCVESEYVNSDLNRTYELETFYHYWVGDKEWHRLYNPYNKPCRIIEIQYGDYCDEQDIERRI